MQTLAIALLGLTVIAAPGQARRAPAATEIDEEEVCVGGPKWSPTFAESRDIDSVPVPESYRRAFESGDPCTDVAESYRTLADWHLRFGSAASISAALAHLMDRNPWTRVRADYPRLLRTTFAAALPDLKRAAAMRQPPGLSYSVAHQYLERSERVRRLNQVVHAAWDYGALARQHLRAAEEFADPELLTRAETFLATTLDAATLFASLESRSPSRGLVSFDARLGDADDLRARAALLRARISGQSTDLAAADAILTRSERPTDRRLALYAYSGGNGVCDIADGYGDRDTIEAACREQDDADWRLVRLAVNRAQYDAVAAGMAGRLLDPEYDSWTAVADRLLTLQALPDRGGGDDERIAEDRLRLLLTRAYYGERAIAGYSGEAQSWDERDQRHRVWDETLDLLMQAERLAPSFAAPGRFRRIADRWLAVWRAGPAVLAVRPDRDDRGDLTASPGRQRYAAYLAAALAGLPGQAPGT